MGIDKYGVSHRAHLRYTLGIYSCLLLRCHMFMHAIVLRYIEKSCWKSWVCHCQLRHGADIPGAHKARTPAAATTAALLKRGTSVREEAALAAHVPILATHTTFTCR
jgi:hypothetical protein